MVSYACTHCARTAPVIKYGTNRNGTLRLKCKACVKAFTPHPLSRALTPEREAAIERALAERTSQRGIARQMQVSRDTVRVVRKKGQFT